MGIRIESAALITSVQDLGRTGCRRFGLPHSGPMDWWAFRAANQLVGNPPSFACIEIGMTSCTLQMESEGLAAVCGAGYQLFRDEKEVPLWMSFLARPGDQIRLDKSSGGNWAYLAFAGGIQSDVWLGSRSVYPRGNLGRMLQDGDRLSIEVLSPQSRILAGQRFPISQQPAYTQQSRLRMIMGPDAERFEVESLENFFNQNYQVSTQSDRMGYRLAGPPLTHVGGADVISRGFAMGEIQVPGNGQPIVMMADHPTTGGYTSLGTIAKVDWPLLAQSQPGNSKIRFNTTTVPEAQESLIGLIQAVESISNEQEDLWLSL